MFLFYFICYLLLNLQGFTNHVLNKHEKYDKVNLILIRNNFLKTRKGIRGWTGS